MIPNIENRFLGKAMRGKILSAMTNLNGTFSMIRLAAAAMLNETPDAKLRWADVDAVLFVGSRFPSP